MYLHSEIGPRLDRLQLHTHALGREELRRYAERVQRAARAGAYMARPEQAVSHEEVLHWYQHRVRLLLRHDGPTRLHLNESTVSLIKLCSHVNSFSVELRVLTDKYQSSALQLLQAFCQVMSLIDCLDKPPYIHALPLI